MEYENISVTGGSIDNDKGLPIYYDLYAPISGGFKEFPVILFLHGFKGFKDWGPFPDACEEIAAAGFGVLAINLSHNGIGSQKTEYERLDLFETGTLSDDLQDVMAVIRALQKGNIKTSHAELNTDAIGIVGHSRGGHTAIVAAAESDAIRCLVTWAAVADCLSRITEQEIKDWKEQGFTEYKNTRTGQMMRVDKIFYDDLLKNSDKLVALNRVKSINIPALFIHGRDDESVPQYDAEQLYITCPSDEKELRYIEKTGHTFGASHPFTDEEFPRAFQDLLDNTISWFEQYLR